jgi:hypothetical protein
MHDVSLPVRAVCPCLVFVGQLTLVTMSGVLGDMPPYSSNRLFFWVQHASFVVLVAMAGVAYVGDCALAVCTVGLWFFFCSPAVGTSPWVSLPWEVWLRPPKVIPSSGMGDGNQPHHAQANSPRRRRISLMLELLSVAMFLQAVPTVLRSPVWRLPEQDSPPVQVVRVLQQWTFSAASLPGSMSQEAAIKLVHTMMLLGPLVLLLVLGVRWYGYRNAGDQDPSPGVLGLIVGHALPVMGDAIGTMIRLVDSAKLVDKTYAISILSILFAGALVVFVGTHSIA